LRSGSAGDQDRAAGRGGHAALRAVLGRARGAAFALLNRGKTILVLDLKSDDDRKKLKPLLEKADVLLSNSGLRHEPAGTWLRRGARGQSAPDLLLDFRLRAERTTIREAGHDLNSSAITGLQSLQPGPADRPVVPPALVAILAGARFRP
jgi:crotonobetainyl-CoA:carnitine CoA-transferase CaiB-like acyl-CoA transferase